MYAARKQIGNIAHSVILAATCVYGGGDKCFKVSVIFFFFSPFIYITLHVCHASKVYE